MKTPLTFKTLAALAAAVAFTAPAAWATPIVGAGSPGTLTTSTTGSLGAASGSANATATLLTLVSGSADPNGCPGGVYSVLGPCSVRAIYTVRGSYSFDWAYSTADVDGPAGDMFGVLVDGAAITLSDLGGPITQSGRRSFTALTSFGWFTNCTDCTGGVATTRVSNLSFVGASVPEPATLGLVVFGLLGGAGAAWRRGAASRRD